MAWKYPNGRTMREAAAAGDSYRLVRKSDGAKYWPPGCAGIEEVVAGFKARFAAEGAAFWVERILPGSGVGCMVVEDAGEIVI